MQYRVLGRTGLSVSTVSFGAWAIGGAWGTVRDDESLAALHRAIDLGVNFVDTADVYGDGHSERLVARVRKARTETVYVATKAGRRLPKQLASAYTRENLTDFIERSLKNLEMEALDLLQLHCPPTDVYYMPEVFDILDDLVRQGKIRYYGVSVERVEEALKAIEFEKVQSVQIIYNVFRQRPADLLFSETARRRVGILARLPLSSGVLAGKMTAGRDFEDDDHRRFNREGAAFDRGETFSGVPYDLALRVVDELRPLVPAGMSMAQWALRWILMQNAVTCAIPGAKRSSQTEENCAAADMPELSEQHLERVRNIYETRVKPLVHHGW
ncbi:aldo/keto reductase [Myxococcota bacterium]